MVILLVLLILGALLGFLLGDLLPWWYLVALGLLLGTFLAKTGWKTFLAGFVGGFVVWFGASFFWISQTDSAFASQIAQLLQLPGEMALLLVAGALSGLLTGLATWSGLLLRRALAPPPKRRTARR